MLWFIIADSTSTKACADFIVNAFYLGRRKAIAEQNAHISEYERMRAELVHIQAMVEAFKEGEEKETNVVKSVTTFAQGIKSWWDKKHAEIVTKTFDMGLFASGVGICSMAGAGGKMSVVVSAVLV
jgi:hypothetical protein